MSYLVSPEFFRVALLGGIVALHVQWRQLVNTIVPEPYLDEVFHIPQVQNYWAGRWQTWDPKITTPAGLYYVSWVYGKIRQVFNPEYDLSTEQLRLVNFGLLYVLLFVLYVWSAVSRRDVNSENVLQREFAITLFPLFFFFSGLYYTDLFSAVTVMLCYTFWSAGSRATGNQQIVYQTLHFVVGCLSLMTRQTNVFWVAIFLGGLQLVKTVKEAFAKEIHDPPVSEAFFEDFPITSISILQHIKTEDIILQLFFEMWPCISLLTAFVGFVIGNGGVVLGDRSNHIATLHLPQMLYIWPAFVFFSWPVLIPFVIDLFSKTNNVSRLRSRLPRTQLIICFVGAFAAIIRFNTIIHPFTLADNRHYTFYVFALLRIPLVKYWAVPVYFVSAWLCIAALGKPSGMRKAQDYNDVTVSWVLIFLLSTSLSLITAPLVEPRYFIVPWLVWRLHLPEVQTPETSSENTVKADDNSKVKRVQKPNLILRLLVQYSTWLELLWYICINVVTGYMFFYRGFSWKQEPGKVQRFMW